MDFGESTLQSIPTRENREDLKSGDSQDKQNLGSTSSGKASVVSSKKLAANRKNARLSTGPKTTRGKRTVARNALKHGLLAKTILANEDEEAIFLEIWEGCQKYYQPFGMPEEILVKDIAISYLQEIRGQRYEAGEIRKQTLNALVRPQSEPVFQDEMTDACLALGTFTSRALSSSQEINYVLKMLEELRKALEGGKGVSQTSLLRLSQYLGKDWQELGDARIMLARVQAERRHLEQFKTEMENFEAQLEAAHVNTLALPSPKVMPNLLRYSMASLNRRYRAMTQLERMQRRRQGEPVPPPLEVNLNSNGA